MRPNGTLAMNNPRDKHGNYSEQFAASGIVSELLLQSVWDIFRIFPAWPKEKDGEFANLRAEGGFLVSARQSGGKITRLEILATVGGKLRLLSPWPTIRVGNRKLTADERGIVRVPTQAGERLVFSAAR